MVERLMTTSLVPYKNTKVQVYSLVDKPISFDTREQVRHQLPDICGNVLARAWIDKEYEKMLQDDLWGTFASGGVILHDDFKLEYNKTSGNRAKITIYEQHENSKFKFKVCSLTLTMMAQR
jgi:hypothetical protein